jgi:hypothetical protein
MKSQHYDLPNTSTSAVTTFDDRNVGCFFLNRLNSCLETVPNVIGSLRVTRFVDSMYSELTMSLPPWSSSSVYLKEM